MYAVLWIPDFPLQAVVRTQPRLAGRAVALLAGEKKDSAVVACTAQARRAGVSVGLTGMQALARCADLVICAADSGAETEADAALLAAGFVVSPLVEVTEPGRITLDLSGHPHEVREARLRAALAQLDDLGLQVKAGLAGSPLLAAYAAQCAGSILVVENTRTFLAPLPLSIAQPSAQLATVLADWGVRTLGDLTDLPKAAIAERLGAEGLALWERAAGESRRPLHPAVPPKTFSARYESEHEWETVEPVLFLLRRFVDRLSLDLSTAGFAAAVLTVALTCADGALVTRTIQLPEPSTQADALFRALHSWLETLRTAAAIRAVQLEIEPVRAQVRQQGIFDNTLRDPHGFAETLARIAAIVGPGRVGTPQLEDTHRPDAFTLAPPARTLAPVEPSRPFFLRGLPLHRFRPPLAVQVELTGAWPSYVVNKTHQDAVANAAGPYRESGGWWEKRWSREVWDVELAGGGLYRLVHERDRGGWFLEGEYT